MSYGKWLSTHKFVVLCYEFVHGSRFTKVCATINFLIYSTGILVYASEHAEGNSEAKD